MAFENAGFYSEREFDFSPYKRLGNAVIELGRACVHRDHRSTDVLYLLWRGIAQYAIGHGGRYLIGCSSLTSQDPAHGTAVYEAMREHLVDPQLRTTPQPAFAMPLISPEGASDKIPKLLRAYLAVGAKICGPPAIDREFKTIDFLTLMDLETLHPRVLRAFHEDLTIQQIRPVYDLRSGADTRRHWLLCDEHMSVALLAVKGVFLGVGYLHQARSAIGSRPTGALARGPMAQVSRRGTCPRTYTNSRRQGSRNDATHHFGRRDE